MRAVSAIHAANAAVHVSAYSLMCCLFAASSSLLTHSQDAAFLLDPSISTLVELAFCFHLVLVTGTSSRFHDLFADTTVRFWIVGPSFLGRAGPSSNSASS